MSDCLSLSPFCRTWALVCDSYRPTSLACSFNRLAGLDVQCDVHFRAAKKNEVDRPSWHDSIQCLSWIGYGQQEC